MALGQILLLLLMLAVHPLDLRAAAASTPTALIAARLAAHLTASAPLRVGDNSLDKQRLAEFYRRRGHAPAWITVGGAHTRADSLVAALRGADAQGLEPDEYHLAAIVSRLAATEPAPLAELDLLLSDAFLRYCRDVRSGRADPRDADPEWFLFADRIDHLAALENALANDTLDAVLGTLQPADPRYLGLGQALRRYRAIAAEGGWRTLPPAATLRLGDRGGAVSALRQRLGTTGDLGAAPPSDRFDQQVERAVRRFQRRHGLTADGIVGHRTRAALNTPVQERIRQLVLTMERWRWMPRQLGQEYLLVNMAGFELQAVHEGAPGPRMRVIVGRDYQRTPTFSESIRYLVINPFWNIPPSIAGRDILPRVREDAEYLGRNSIRVFRDWSEAAEEMDPASVDWDTVPAAPFPYKLRQDPGPGNALGRIKFMLPNRFNVYLHDTPHRELFEEPARAFSSGCVRLEHPVTLAAHLLRNDPRWDGTALRAAIEGGRRTVIRLHRPVPVYLVYWTSWVEPDGMVQFRRDIYGRDRLLADALAGERSSLPID